MGTNHEIDDGLTDEERAALEEDEGGEGAGTEAGEGAGNAGDATDTGAGAGEGEGDEGGDGNDAADADADDSGAAAGEAGDAGTGQDGAAAEGEPGQPAAQSAPLLVVQAPEDADAKLKEIGEKKEALLTQFDDGDITAKEYQTQLDALAKQERDIELQLHTAKIAQEMELTRQRNEWARTVDGFIKEHPIYSAEKNPRMYKLLDAEVRAVAVTEEFKNRNDAEAGRAILEKAHANIAAELGFDAKGKPAAGNKASAKAQAPDLPPNLAKVPSADMSDTSGGKYASLDRLQATDPIAYEEALMKLSDAERAAYLAA